MAQNLGARQSGAERLPTFERTLPFSHAAGFFRFHSNYSSEVAREGFVDVWQKAQSQGFEAEEEGDGDGDEEDGDAEESKAGLICAPNAQK